MSTTSKPRRLFAGLAAASVIALGACIQGPWDYYPENPAPFRGVFVAGYVLAGEPVRHVCFERVLNLGEEATQAYPFYDSANVRIAGRFSGVDTQLVLHPMDSTPNCFLGDPLALADSNASYGLTARIVWDSAGKRVVTNLTSTANVPRGFTLHRDATAPSLATSGQIPDNIFTLEFFLRLPADVRDTLQREFPDALPLIAKPGFDTTAEFRAYITANGAKIQKRVLELLQNDYTVYPDSARLFYLSGSLNTLSHYYSAERSDDVKAVLITQRYEDTSSRPATAFDSPLGMEPDSQDFYFPGTVRRLLIYPDAKGGNGYNLLDSMGVVNVWFHTGWNRLNFYGFEQAYYSYTSTVLENGGDPKIKPKYNVEGGRGFFVGGIPQHFDVFIMVDTTSKIKVYPLPITHGLHCSDEGWQSEKDCRNYYRTWCDERNWAPADCGQDAITACLEADHGEDSLKARNDSLRARCSPKADSARSNPVLAERGNNQFCIEQNFPDSLSVCVGPRDRCLETSGVNDCKRALWNYCLDRAWKPDQCKPALASYCHDRPRLSETLCKNSDDYCAANPGSPLCK